MAQTAGELQFVQVRHEEMAALAGAFKKEEGDEKLAAGLSATAAAPLRARMRRRVRAAARARVRCL